MASRDTKPWLDPTVSAYVAARAAPPDDVLRDLARETREKLGDRSIMQISGDEGALLSLLTRIVRAVSAGIASPGTVLPRRATTQTPLTTARVVAGRTTWKSVSELQVTRIVTVERTFTQEEAAEALPDRQY